MIKWYHLQLFFLFIFFGTVHLQKTFKKISWVLLEAKCVINVLCVGRMSCWALLTMNNLKENSLWWTCFWLLAKFHIHKSKFCPVQAIYLKVRLKRWLIHRHMFIYIFNCSRFNLKICHNFPYDCLIISLKYPSGLMEVKMFKMYNISWKH